MRSMPPSFRRGALLAVLLLAPPAAASAAVTNRAATPEDTPRTGWLERYQDNRQGPEQTDRVTRSTKVGDAAVLDLSNIAGDVRVTGGSGNEIRIDAIKRVRHRDADTARQLLAELRVEITQVGDRLEVRTFHPRRSGNMRNVSISVDYVITMPAAAAAVVKTISGNLTVGGVRGEVRAETISGDVELSGTPNVAVGKTVSGSVRARDIGGAGTLSIGTVSGSVIATGLKVRALECGSVSGDIQLSGLQVERVQAKTVSGSIEFDSPLAKGGRYELTAHSGNVRVLLSSPTGFELNASTFGGSVRSDFPVALRSSDDGRRGGTRTIRGTFGDGSALLAVQSFSGSVVIAKK
jgi:DUF4097 and DUF4098 domain-containing protein YvlB